MLARRPALACTALAHLAACDLSESTTAGCELRHAEAHLLPDHRRASPHPAPPSDRETIEWLGLWLTPCRPSSPSTGSSQPRTNSSSRRVVPKPPGAGSANNKQLPEARRRRPLDHHAQPDVVPTPKLPNRGPNPITGGRPTRGLATPISRVAPGSRNAVDDGFASSCGTQSRRGCGVVSCCDGTPAPP